LEIWSGLLIICSIIIIIVVVVTNMHCVYKKKILAGRNKEKWECKLCLKRKERRRNREYGSRNVKKVAIKARRRRNIIINA
jgi:hypothetical protein